MSVIHEDPCRYCGKPLAEVRATGCGSEEFPQKRVNDLCEIYQRVIKTSNRQE